MHTQQDKKTIKEIVASEVTSAVKESKTELKDDILQFKDDILTEILRLRDDIVGFARIPSGRGEVSSFSKKTFILKLD